MTKRIIALLLALILTVGLLPTVALAADGENPTTDSGSVTKEANKDNLNLVKTVTKEGDNYKVTLESWATGTVTSSSTPVPMDIILLLDQSGSMDDRFTSSSQTEYNRLNRKNEKIYKDYRDKLYIYEKSEYVKVKVEKETIVFGKNKYTYTWNGGSFVSYGDHDYPAKTFYYQTTNTSSQKKIDALKTAVNKFVTKVSEEATSKNVEHRVAIVGFASTKGYSGNYQNTELLSTEKEVNYADAKANNYEDALVSAKTKKDRLDTAIKRLDANGDTYPEYGFDMANKIFAQYPIQDGDNRQRVVIMFTDGYPAPAYTDNFDVGMANDAINNARTCKDNNAKVYTIGIFDGANPSASIENYYYQNGRLNQGVAANRYMHFSSSNYPSATALNNGGTRGEGNFYFAASNADALNDIFDTISEEISTDTTELDGSATIIDNIPGNFTIPDRAQGIKIYTAKCAGKKGETLSWENREDSTLQPTMIPNATTGVTSVSVAGFDYSDEWCGLDENNQPHGSKLIIEFTIKHNNYGGTQPTNAGASIKDKEKKDVITVDNPSVPVTIDEPSITGASETKIYDGKGIDVIANIKAAADALVTGTNKGKNQYVTISVAVKVDENTTYTYTIPAGAESGSWDSTTPTLITGKDVNTYKYDLTIAYTDAAPNTDTTPAEPKTASAKATYTINKRPVTLTSKTASKPYDGNPLTETEVTVTDYNDGKNVFNSEFTAAATGTITEPGGPVANTITVTPKNGALVSNYEITKNEGKLTITQDETTKITVTITGKNATKEYDGTALSAEGYDVSVSGANASDVSVSLNTGKQAKANGTDVKSASEDNGEYRMGLTKDDFTVTSNKYKSIEVTYTDGYVKITPAQVTLTSASDSKDYDGTPLIREAVTVTGTGKAVFEREVTEIKATGTVTDPGPAVDNTITYTTGANFKATNYNISKSEGKLTITGSKTYTITFKTTNDGKINDAYDDVMQTVNAGADFPNRPTTTPNTGYYFDGWYKDGETTKTENFPSTVTENATYTAKWTQYTPLNLDLTGKIQKTLNSDVELSNQTFTINLTRTGAETSAATASATATATVIPVLDNGSYTDTRPFVVASGDFKLTFTAPGTYIYSIVEVDDRRTGMTYDVGKPANGHSMTVVVGENSAHALTFTSVTVDGTAIDNVYDENNTNWLTITNTYVEPKETFDLNTLITKEFKKDPTREGKDIPTGTYEFKAKVAEADSGFGELVNGAKYEGTVTLNAAGTASFDFGDDRYLKLAAGPHYYRVSEISNTATTTTGTITYDSQVRCLTIVVDDDGEVSSVNVTPLVVVYSTAEEAVEFEGDNHITFTNTYFEKKDPNKLTINFADFVQKELTATGSKTASDVDFTVDVKGKEWITIITSAKGEEAISTYADEFDPKYSRTLTAHFDSITGGETKTAPFNGSTVEIDHADQYFFVLTEEKGTRTGVTYDESVYTVYISVEEKEGKLEVANVTIYKDYKLFDGQIITFHNTIDTGRDDYIPIIIPTIINKDTGMLNKTDHFAYVIGYPDGTVHPNGQITRAEVATIFFRLLRDEVRDGAFTTSNTYSDVAYGKWYNNPISTMSALGIITGYPDGTFKPNKPITRAEFAAIAARFDETQSGKSATFSDVIGHWAAKEIGIAYYNDWIKGYPDGTFKPDQNITRAEAMTLINRVLERKPESPADLLTNMNKWTDNMDTSKWYYLDVQEATNSHGYTRKTFNYELWRQMLPDPDWSRYER